MLPVESSEGHTSQESGGGNRIKII